MTTDTILLIASLLLLVSVLVSKASNRIGIPAMLGFLVVGMLAGSDGPGGIYFDDARLSQGVGVVALTFILFAGGLDTNWREVRPALPGALLLATLGVFLTMLLMALFTIYLLHFSLLEGLLFGAIISSTDAAAVFGVLQTKQLRLKGKITATLELESGCNDPMAVFLTLGLTELLVDHSQTYASIGLLFVMQMGLGALFGLLLSRGALWVIERLHLEINALYTVLTVALALFIYSLTASVHGSGFLAIYLSGLVLGNSTLRHLNLLKRFHDNLAWLMQIVMFLTLGLLIFPSHLPPIIAPGLLIALFLIFVARPVSVLLSLAFVKMSWREKLFISWVGLRGAVPIILATFPLLAGVSRSSYLFDLVFFVVVASVLLQGTTISTVARFLGVIVEDEAPVAVPA